MSSPNHHTSNIEDGFSSNFPDYLPASPDYVPASPGKTYSSSSNSFGLVPLASPTLFLFHDDPYMKSYRMPSKSNSASAALASEAPAMTQAAIRNCIEDCKVKFATGTLTEEALSWWNYFAQPIGIEEAYKITWVEFKKLLLKKYCPLTEIQKMEDEFYHLIVKGNDLKTYVRRF
nr:reverse transcriptase domain-containing protein [Tanacetum cinerariifolium]